ncbi:hypothetical protein [Cohnella lupini]|uniref:Uncharacterized protein n=1 Tax=Cohnella lupini TaxID=1294267 RepID=A0A3D9HQJ8_9BACL|nr:hypothetical protein [Cohnella lupini]RED51804.1 hypothetical protein DFP95_13827 [Cohnella lupini]
MSRKLVSALIVLSASVLIVIFILVKEARSPSIPDEEFVTIVHNQMNLDSEVSETMKSLNAELTKLVGDGTDYFTVEPYTEAYWSEFIDNTSFNEDKLIEIISNLTVDSIREDLQTAQTLIDIAKKNRDVQAIKYAYQIISDLDLWLFNMNSENKKYFAATNTFQTFESKKIVNKIKKYIDANS